MPPSPWLYLAGLVVTLCGLFAVNYYLGDPQFAVTTYGLAGAGYLTSYLVRRSGRNLSAVQLPATVLIALLLLVFLSGDRPSGFLVPYSAQDDRFKMLQVLFAWMAVIQTFMLSADAAVLFACVPCMTMLALVSTRTPDLAVQRAFILFMAAGTFLMVHENYLRTRLGRARSITKDAKLATASEEQKDLFGGQLKLAAICIFGALLLATLVAVPIQTIGESLFSPAGVAPFTSRISQAANAAGVNLQLSSDDSVDLASGPVTATDTPILKVQCDRPFYWKLSDLTRYTGVSFATSGRYSLPLDPTARPADAQQSPTASLGSDPGLRLNWFVPPVQGDNIALSDMRGATTHTAKVTLVGAAQNDLCGAEQVEDVGVAAPNVRVSASGALSPEGQSGQITTYVVDSVTPCVNPALLRRASSSLADVPPAIRAMDLQTAVNGADNPALAALAAEVTRGLDNNYDRAVAIQRYIADQCAYNLRAPAAPRNVDAVQYFLFRSRQGYCDCFAAAMTMLCRYARIPARMARGFLYGKPQSDGSYLVRDRDQHLWTEVFFPHIGWAPFDATEGTRDVTPTGGQTLSHNAGFGAWMLSHGPLPLLLAGLALATITGILAIEAGRRFTRLRVGRLIPQSMAPTNAAVIRAYLEACYLLGRHGLPRALSSTPEEYLRLVQGSLPLEHSAVLPPLELLTAWCEEFRYGQATATDADVTGARHALAGLRDAVAARSGRLRIPVRAAAPAR